MKPLLLASAAFGVGGAFMKPASGFTRVLPSLAVLSCFLVGSVFLTVAVNRGNLSSTYVIGVGLEATLAVGFGLVVLHERLTMLQIAGVVLIICGILLLRR